MNAVAESKPDIERLEAELLTHPEADVGGEKTCRLAHHFGPGVYIRELWRPAGTVIIGHEHRTEHLNILVTGRLRVLMGDKVHDIVAPSVFLSKAGCRKITRAMEDSILMTVHPTNERDLDKLEDELVAKSEDYLRFVEDTGMPHEMIDALMRDESDMVPMPEYDSVVVEIRESAIHGQGVFAKVAACENILLAHARIGSKRTPVGRYTNHSQNPNARMVPTKDGDIDLVSMQMILPGDEITTDYRFNKLAAEMANGRILP